MAANHLRIIARGLSTSSGRLALVQPPMQVYGTEGRYATALYSAASKKNVLDAVEKDLASFNTTLKKDPRLGDFLADPSIKKALKAEGLAGVCDKLKMNELSKNMFLAMAENGRYSFMSAAVLSFSTIMAAHRGEVVCEVTTAKPLDAAMQKEVEAALSAFLQKGQKSLINYKVKPEIIGGMVVSIADRFVDMSTATKLKKYSEMIQAAA